MVNNVNIPECKNVILIFFFLSKGRKGDIYLFHLFYLRSTKDRSLMICFLASIFSLLVEYRRFQLYVGMSNVCLAPLDHPYIYNISAWMVLIAVGVYTAIRLYGAIPFPIFGLFVYLGWNGLVACNFILKENGKIHKISEEILEKFRIGLTISSSDSKGTGRKIRIQIHTRDVKSMNVLKIEIGSSNLFEIKTPLEILRL